MYKRIVVPLDGSELAELALPHAEELARLTGSPIHLVRVIDVTRVRGFGPVGLAVEHTAFEQMLAAEESASPEYLAKVERDINSRGLTATQQILRGSVNGNRIRSMGKRKRIRFQNARRFKLALQMTGGN